MSRARPTSNWLVDEAERAYGVIRDAAYADTRKLAATNDEFEQAVAEVRAGDRADPAGGRSSTNRAGPR